MNRWEQMEEWLFTYFDAEPRPSAQFTSIELSVSTGISRTEASRWIQAYLAAQRRSDSGTLYVLKREGRTGMARWSVGQRTADARVISHTLFDDVRTKVQRAWKPDLERLAERNPRAARYVEAKLAAIMDGALVMLGAALDDGGPDDGSMGMRV